MVVVPCEAHTLSLTLFLSPSLSVVDVAKFFHLFSLFSLSISFPLSISLFVIVVLKIVHSNLFMPWGLVVHNLAMRFDSRNFLCTKSELFCQTAAIVMCDVLWYLLLK